MYDLLMALAYVALLVIGTIAFIQLTCCSCAYNAVFISMGDFSRRRILAQLHQHSRAPYHHPCS